MPNEAEIGSAEAPDVGRRSRGGRGEPAPLQSRANFLQNWSWASVTQINGGLCERGRAQRGINSEAHGAVAQEWEKIQSRELTLVETFQFLKTSAGLAGKFAAGKGKRRMRSIYHCRQDALTPKRTERGPSSARSACDGRGGLESI